MQTQLSNVDFNGQTIGFVSSNADGSPDQLLQSVMQRCFQRELAENARRDAIRANPELIQGIETGRFNISDRN